MPHGADLLRCLERVRSAQNTEESTSCTLSIKIEPDSRGLVPAIHVSRSVIPGRCAASNSDVQLHIRESRDSGSGAGAPSRNDEARKTWMPGTSPGMTN